MSKLVEALKTKTTHVKNEAAIILPKAEITIATAIAAVGFLKEKKPIINLKDISQQPAHRNINLGEGPICGAICPQCYEYCTIRDTKHSQHSCGQHTW